MSDKKDNIISKDNNIDPIVYQILNEAYYEFKQMYGDKHSEHIKEIIENVTDKMKKDEKNYSGPIASTNHQMGITYSYSEDLPAVLKHELWHIYNDTATDTEKSLQHIPKRYLDKLGGNGYLEEAYNKQMARYKELWANDPEILETLLVEFEEFKTHGFDFGESVVEMWTEWFNSQTHLKNMKENFWDWGDEYFTKTNSSGSFYDSYLNIASMISCIIPKEKLLEMYLQTSDYKTDYSYPEMLEEFDSTYSNSLEEEERNQYQYPYLKIIMDKMVISENARKNPTIAQKALQSSMKTCFNAYLQKLENIKDIDVGKAKEIYAEIKYMQEQMVWNLDISKMKDLDYIQALSKVQDKFKNMMQELGLENLEVKEMFEKIDYTIDNPFEMIEDGEKIAEKINVTSKENRNSLINIDGNKANVGENGVKNNLHRTLFALLGDSKYNLLYENYQGENELNNADNILLKTHKQIEAAKTDEDIINIYNNIYELYINKIETTLKTDENIKYLFNSYSKEIVELQKNGLFNEKNQKYLPKLEQIINIYNEKLKEYEQRIDKATQKDIQMNIEEGRTLEEAKRFSEKVPNICKKELNEYKDIIIIQRKNQIEKYEEIEQKEEKQYEPIIVGEDLKQKTDAFTINEYGEIIRPNNENIKKEQDIQNKQITKYKQPFFQRIKNNIQSFFQGLYKRAKTPSKDQVKKETYIVKKENNSKQNDFKNSLEVSKEVKDNTIKVGQKFQINTEQRDDGENIK